MRDHEAELTELRRSIESIVRAGISEVAHAGSAAATQVPSNFAELEELLRKLGAQLGEAIEDAEESIASHPLTSISAAFLLGLAIGRLTKRG
jgi:ElaB/YqjD/DUF883 family membrane-anchored ribosome-binding protein